MVPSSSDTGSGSDPDPDFAVDPDETDTDEDFRDWRRIEPGLRRAWSMPDLGKAAVPVIVGTVTVSIPYVLVVTWVTETLLSVADGLTPEVAFGIVVFLTLTTFSSFLFSAVMLVERLLPWDSPLAL